MAAKKAVPSYPLWDRFPPPSRLHLVAGVVPELPRTKYISVRYLYETQCHIRVRQLIDTMSKPFDWPGIRELVLARAVWFFDLPSQDEGAWSINEDWCYAKRFMASWYWVGLNDLMAAVQDWLQEFDHWELAKTARRTTAPTGR